MKDSELCLYCGKSTGKLNRRNILVMVMMVNQPAVGHYAGQSGSLLQVLLDHGGYEGSAVLEIGIILRTSDRRKTGKLYLGQYWCSRKLENSLLSSDNIIKWVDSEDHYEEKNSTSPDLLGDPEVSLARQDLGTAEGLTAAVFGGRQSVIKLGGS